MITYPITCAKREESSVYGVSWLRTADGRLIGHIEPEFADEIVESLNRSHREHHANFKNAPVLSPCDQALDALEHKINALEALVQSLNRSLFRHITKYPEKGTEPGEHGAHCECKIHRENRKAVPAGTPNVFAGDAAEPAKDEPHCHFCGAYYDNNLQSWRFKNLPYTAMQPPTRSKPEPTKALFMRKDLIWFEATPSQDVDALRIPAGITEGVYNRIAPGVYVEDGFEKIRNNPQFEQSDIDMIMKIVRTTLDEKGRKGTFYGKAILDFSSEECRDILYYTLSQDFNYFRAASSL